MKMKRGQLTYYFPKKEDILLAVFDRLLLLMYQRIAVLGGCSDRFTPDPDVWQHIQKMFQLILGPERLGTEFHSLQYTFLAQIAHREDFRQRLASLYEEWRTDMAGHWQQSAKPALKVAKTVAPQVISSFVQALVHGLIMQLSADPNAFDRTEMLTLCLSVLAPLFIHVPVGPQASSGEGGFS